MSANMSTGATVILKPGLPWPVLVDSIFHRENVSVELNLLDATQYNAGNLQMSLSQKKTTFWT